ncbi:MAG: hypothetical protein SH818_08210, partial [Saprospiraceae bacterium]|nr:hypothetical protein [Saprospiraceae bacterium]
MMVLAYIVIHGTNPNINDYISKRLLPTKVFAKAGSDNVKSAMCKHHQRYGLYVQFSALVLN